MESANISLLFQKIKEKEERGLIVATKIKNCELVIKNEEEKIKTKIEERDKLERELEGKRNKNSKISITNVILQAQNQIWKHIMVRVTRELKDEENKLDALQQSICCNRTSFCDSVKDYLAKANFLDMEYDTYLNTSSSPKKIKLEQNSFVHNRLLEQKKALENELNNFNNEIKKIEKAKKLKMDLQSEPSNGERFIKLQTTLRSIKEDISKLDLQITSIKREISQKEGILMSMKKTKRLIIKNK